MFHHNPARLFRAVLMSGVGLSAVAVSAQAGSIVPIDNWAFGETTSIEASGPTASGAASAYYTSVDQGGGYFDVPAGLNATLTDPTSSLIYLPNPAPPGLTGASLSLSADSSAMNVSGSLESGATHMFASSVANTTGCCVATLDAASVEMKDLLTFAVGGTGSETITVGFSLDGNLNAGAPGSYSQLIEFNFGNPLMYWSAATGSGFTTAPTTGWDTFGFTGDSISGFDFTGTLTITDGEEVPISFIQQLNCNNSAECDFSNTAQMSLSLPSDVSYTSASGAFLTQISSTPEPSSLMLIGLGIAVFASRRRRSAP